MVSVKIRQCQVCQSVFTHTPTYVQQHLIECRIYSAGFGWKVEGTGNTYWHIGVFDYNIVALIHYNLDNPYMIATKGLPSLRETFISFVELYRALDYRLCNNIPLVSGR